VNSAVKNRINFWPIGIVAVLIFMIFVCVMLVRIAMQNPPQMDNFYFEKYQKVDENINAIMERQKVFEENFALKYKTQKFTIGEHNSFEMSIKNINNHSLVKNAEITLLISRPDTNKHNQEFVLKNAKNGVYIFEGIEIGKPGRWQVLTKIKIGDKSSFNQHEVFASK